MHQIQVETDTKVLGSNPNRGHNIDRSELKIICQIAGHLVVCVAYYIEPSDPKVPNGYKPQIRAHSRAT